MSQLDYLKHDVNVIEAGRNEALDELKKAKEFSDKFLREVVETYFGQNINAFRADPADPNSAVDHNKIADHIKNNARKINMSQRDIIAKKMAAKVSLKDKILLQKKELANKILKNYAIIVEENNKIIEQEKQEILADEKKSDELLAEQKAAEAKCESLENQIPDLQAQIDTINAQIEKETVATKINSLNREKLQLQQKLNFCRESLTENKGIIARNEQTINSLELENRKAALLQAIKDNDEFVKKVNENKKVIKEEYAKERTNLDDPDIQNSKEQEVTASNEQSNQQVAAQNAKGAASSGGGAATMAGNNLPVEYQEEHLAKNILKNFLSDNVTPQMRRSMLEGRGFGDLIDALKHASASEKREVLEIINERKEEVEEIIDSNYESKLASLLENTLGNEYMGGSDYILSDNGLRNFDSLDAADLYEVKKILERISDKRNDLSDDELKDLEDKFLSPLRYSVLSYQCKQTVKDRLMNNNFFVRFLGKNSVIAKRNEIISLIKTHNEISFTEKNSISEFQKSFDAALKNVNDLEYSELPESIRAGEISMNDVNPLSKKKAEREAR